MPVPDTQRSSNQYNGNNTIILIKPTKKNGKDLINDPITSVKVIQDSKFGKLNVSNIKTNKRKGLLVAEMEQVTPGLIEELLSVKCVGKWKVHCYIPERVRNKYGVISPISIDTDLNKIKEYMTEKYNAKAVERLKKRLQNGEWVASSSIKLTFESEHLSSDVILEHSFYRLRPYVPPPVQCYRFQRLGHTAYGCRARIRCLVCGEEHDKLFCKAQIECCANCHGNHKANSKFCEQYKRAQNIEREKAQGNLSFSQTTNRIERESAINESRSNLNRQVVFADVHNDSSHATPVLSSNRSSYGNVVMRRGMQNQSSRDCNINSSLISQIGSVKNVSTQTEISGRVGDANSY